MKDATNVQDHQSRSEIHAGAVAGEISCSCLQFGVFLLSFRAHLLPSVLSVMSVVGLWASDERDRLKQMALQGVAR